MLDLFLFTFLLLLARFASVALVVHLFLPLGGWMWGLGLAGVLAAALTPLTHLMGPFQVDLNVWAVGQECLLGASYGVTLTLALAILRGVGTVAAASLPPGLGPGQDAAGPAPMERLFFLLAVACFLSVRGDQLVLDQLLQSLRRYPPGECHLTPGLLPALTDTLSSSLRFAAAMAAPLLAATVFSHLVVALMCRTLPSTWSAGVGTAWTTAIFAGVSWLGLLGLTWALPHQLPRVWQSFARCLFGSG